MHNRYKIDRYGNRTRMLFNLQTFVDKGQCKTREALLPGLY